MVGGLMRWIVGSVGLGRLIKQGGKSWQGGTVLASSVIGLVLGTWIASFFMPTDVLSTVVGIFLSVSPILYLYIMREIRSRKCDGLVPEAVGLMARGLRAGHAVSAVMEMVGQEIAEPLAGE